MKHSAAALTGELYKLLKSSLKTRTRLSLTVNTMAADYLRHREPRHQQAWNQPSLSGMIHLGHNVDLAVSRQGPRPDWGISPMGRVQMPCSLQNKDFIMPDIQSSKLIQI